MRPTTIVFELLVLAAVAGLYGISPARAQDLVISEFMAVNSGTILDEDGETSDWIEVHNQGFLPVDLDGWYLTDDAGDRENWPFPAVTLEGGDYLLVFASGKDRRGLNGELHTSFRLGGSGEYLALVRPDGTVAHEYNFPRQRPDLSYGIGEDLLIDSLVPERAAAKVLIPHDDSPGTSWRGGDEPFDDSSWLGGRIGVGYLISQSGFAVRTFLAATGVGSLSAAEDVIRNSGLQVQVFAENAAVIDFYNTGGTGHYPNDNPFPGTSVGTDENDFVVEVTGSITLPAAGAWTFGVNSDDGFGLDLTGPGGSFRIEYPSPRGPADTLGVFDAGAAGTYDLRLVFYERGGGAELELFARRGGYSSWDSGFRLVGDTAAGGLDVFSQPVGTASSNIRDLIATDVREVMHEVNATAYVRIPFSIDDPGAYESLALRMKYDDGFIAYVNGVEVARRNAPASAGHDARATLDRPSAQTLSYQHIDVSEHLGLLRAGPNLLAIHALNDKPDSHDFLIVAELAELTVVPQVEGFFAETTPGASNDQTFLNFVEDTKFSPDRGFFDNPFVVGITTATPGAEIRYTLDGSEPTPTHGDLYGGPIQIASTTVLRAAAFKSGLVPSDVDTQTYIFLDDILTQTGAGFPSSWGGDPVDYEMDPDVVNDPLYSATLRDDLKSIPSMSIVMHVEDLFGASRGIYSHPTSSGRAWERPGSVELILPEGVEIPGGGNGFHVNCGVRIYGGVGRQPRFFKHSFRFLFKGVYGPTKLDYPLFADAPQIQGGEATSKFDTLILRAGFNNSWIIGGGQSNQTQYLRDQFMRDTLLAMGRADPHGTFVHLYLNGLYWGLYNLVERPSAPFCAAYFGGSKNDWDALNSGSAIDGDKNAWNEMHALANAGLSSNGDYEAIQEYLDVPNLIDYMIVNFYGGNADWDGHNWYSGRYREPGAGYKFFSWDAERTLEGTGSNRTGINNAGNPSGLYAALRANAEFRLLFADHVHRNCFNSGSMAAEVNAERYRLRAEEIDRAIVGESARWGDTTRETPYTRDVEWIRERDRLLNEYFPRRTGILVSQLRAIGLYPAVDAPRFNQHGGAIAEGFTLLMTATDGTVYYTLDGTDPRLPGGALHPAALVAGSASTTELVASGAPVRALVPQDGALGLEWTEVDFDDFDWIAGTTGVGYERSSGYEDLISTDLGDLMYGVNASCYVRLRFEIEEPAAVGFPRLRMKYEDGFIAYLNGERVAARNAPATPQWNSMAAASHSDSEAVVFETFDLSGAASLLRAGANVLAIHGLNVGLTSSDLLILPELDVTSATGGEGVVLERTTQVKARVLADGEWSALNEAVFMVEGALPLRVTELMYHPVSPGVESPFIADDFEFVEVRNVGSEAVSLQGVRFSDAIEFDFSSGDVAVLGPGDYVVVVKDRGAFATRYDTVGVLIAGEYTGRLSNGGENLTLLGPFDEMLATFAYDDTWYPSTDGEGYSLVILDPLAPVETWGDREAWQPSGRIDGSPGYDDDGPGPGGLQRPGDSNQDGTLDLSDAVSLLVRLFRAADLPSPCEGDSIEEAGNLAVLDVNGDSGVDVSDVIHVLAYLFQGGPPPAAGKRCARVVGCPSVCSR